MLAPMAGVTDAAFRSVCAGFGAAATLTEMVSARALVYRDKKSAALLAILPEHRPCAAQIFGSDPDIMAEAARMAADIARPDWIDVNMGCPVHKIVANGEGSALMRDPDLAARIIGAVVSAVALPVTVKFRAGFDQGSATAPDFARMAESAGAAAVCVQGRTRAQMYGGVSDRSVIRAVKQAVSIPVAASGDAFSAADCLSILRETGADAVMIARGALGNPMIFSACLAAWRGEPTPVFTADGLIDTMIAHVRLAVALKGENRMPELRKHLLWYLGRLQGAKAFKAEMAQVADLPGFLALAARLRAANLPLKANLTDSVNHIGLA
jgi:nifR3 family TIM-barrel protein